MPEKTELSVVIPVYNEEKNIPPLYEILNSVITNLKKSAEIVFVDDGSTDDTVVQVEKLNKKDSRVRCVVLQRNFGKAAALSAGFAHAKGEIIVTMDGDLQDDPNDLALMIAEIEKGYDFVNGWKSGKHKEHSIISALFSVFFNKLSSAMTGIMLHDFNCPFKAYRKKAAKGISLYGEMHRYIPVILHRDGYSMSEVKVKNMKRKFGKSKYGYSRLVKGFLDLITVFFMTKYSRRPLHFFGTVGIIALLAGLITFIVLIVRRFVFMVMAQKEAWFLLGILLIIVGIQVISVGLIGEMITRMEMKNKPGYVIRKSIG